MFLAEVDWTNAVWIPALITVFVGGPISIWAAFIVVRLTDFRHVIRTATGDILSSVGRMGDFDAHLARASKLHGYYSILYEQGQRRAATELTDIFGEHEQAVGIFVEQAKRHREGNCTAVDRELAFDGVRLSIRTAAQRLAALRPEPAPILFGTATDFLTYQPASSDEDATVI